MTLSKVYLFPSPHSSGLSLASKKVILDVARFSSELSFKQVFLGSRGRLFGALQYYFKLIMEWLRSDVALAIYPYICINLRRRYLLRMLESILINKLCKKTYSMLYIVDLPIEREIILGTLEEEKYKRDCKVEKRIFDGFDTLLVFNEDAKKSIQRKYGFGDDKFVLFEMLDYWVENPPQRDFNFRFPLEIAFLASSFDQEGFSWIKDLPYAEEISNYYFYGTNGDWIKRLSRVDLKYMGYIPPDDIPEAISNHHFGMINYDSSIERYLQYGSTSKFTAYIAAGLPIIYPSKLTYISTLAQKYGVGIPFRSLHEIPEILSKLSEATYNEMRKNSMDLGEKVRRGYFLKNAINIALQRSGIPTT